MRDDVIVSEALPEWPQPGVSDPDEVWARIEPRLGRQRHRWIPSGSGRWLVPSGVAAAVAGAVLVASTVVGGGEAVAVTRLVDDLDSASRTAVADRVVSDDEGSQIAAMATRLAGRLDDSDVFADVGQGEMGRIVIALGDIGALLGEIPDFPELDSILEHLEDARSRFGGEFGGFAEGPSTFRAGPAGTVTMESQDGGLVVVSTEPSDGWQVESSSSEDGRVEVVFGRDGGGTVTLVAEQSDGGLAVSVTSDGMPLDLELSRELPFLDGQRLSDLFEGLPSLEDLLSELPPPGDRFPDLDELFPGFFEQFDGWPGGDLLAPDIFGDLPRLEDITDIDEFLADLQTRVAEQLGDLPTYGILSDGGRSVHSVAGVGTVTLGYDGELQVVSADPADGWTADVVTGAGDDVEVVFRRGGEEAVFKADTSSALVRVTVERSGA